MGIIIKESFNQTSIRIAISMIAALSTIFIYPMDRSMYGLLAYVLNTAVLLMPFVIMGVSQSSLRFFPYNDTTISQRKNFLGFLIKILIGNMLIVTVLFYLLKDLFIAFSNNPSQDYNTYFIYILPGALLFALLTFLVSYISNYKIVAIPVGLQSMYRIAIPIVFLLIYFKKISVGIGILMVYFILFVAIVILIFMILKAIKKQTVVKGEMTSVIKKKKAFYQFYFWAFASSLGSMVAFRIDGYMVPTLTDFTLGGDYMMALFMTGVIVIPTSSVIAIAHPIISEAWKEKDMTEIKNVYLKGSKNLLFIGAVMLIGILLLLDFLPIVLDSWKELTHLKWIVLVLGIGKLFDMASSVNGVIIAHSKWYRYNTLFVIILVVSNVLLNYILILEYGIIGAAIATAISLIIFNFFKTILLQWKISIHPFDRETILFGFSLMVLLLLICYLPFYINAITALIINVVLCTIYFYLVLFVFKYAIDTQNAILLLLNKYIK